MLCKAKSWLNWVALKWNETLFLGVHISADEVTKGPGAHCLTSSWAIFFSKNFATCAVFHTNKIFFKLHRDNSRPRLIRPVREKQKMSDQLVWLAKRELLVKFKTEWVRLYSDNILSEVWWTQKARKLAVTILWWRKVKVRVSHNFPNLPRGAKLNNLLNKISVQSHFRWQPQADCLISARSPVGGPELVPNFQILLPGSVSQTHAQNFPPTDKQLGSWTQQSQLPNSQLLYCYNACLFWQKQIMHVNTFKFSLPGGKTSWKGESFQNNTSAKIHSTNYLQRGRVRSEWRKTLYVLPWGHFKWEDQSITSFGNPSITEQISCQEIFLFLVISNLEQPDPQGQETNFLFRVQAKSWKLELGNNLTHWVNSATAYLIFPGVLRGWLFLSHCACVWSSPGEFFLTRSEVLCRWTCQITTSSFQTPRFYLSRCQRGVHANFPLAL